MMSLLPKHPKQTLNVLGEELQVLTSKSSQSVRSVHIMIHALTLLIQQEHSLLLKQRKPNPKRKSLRSPERELFGEGAKKGEEHGTVEKEESKEIEKTKDE
jgi:hypothetical protein